MEVEEVISDSKIKVYTKQDVFLRLCALNLLNALIKKKEYKEVLGYGMIKPNVMRLALYLGKSHRKELCEEVCFQPEEDCLYLRCYGVQFCFHAVNINVLEEKCSQLCNYEAKWDGVRLQPIAEPLYLLAKETVEQGLDEQAVKTRILAIIQ